MTTRWSRPSQMAYRRRSRLRVMTTPERVLKHWRPQKGMLVCSCSNSSPHLSHIWVKRSGQVLGIVHCWGQHG
jgi:hypothetical protein